MHQPSEESVKEFEKQLKTVVIFALEGVIQPPQEMSIQDMEDLKQQYLDEMKSLINEIQIKDYRNEKIDIQYRRECEIKIDELKQNFNGMSIEIRKKEKELLQQEQAAYVRTSQQFNFIDDDDDDEYSFATQEYLKKFSSAITPDLPKSDSLIMEDKHLDTIPETESDELIKSSVEDLVHTPSESDGISEGECDLPVCDDSSQIDNEVLESIDSIPPGIDHFDAESDLLESLLNQDISIDSSPKIDSFLDEFAGELTLLKSIPPGIDEAKFDPKKDTYLIEILLYDNSPPRPLEELNVEKPIIESPSLSLIPVEDSDSFMEEIDLFLIPDDSMPPGIENDDYDSEGDILFLEELLSNDSPSLPNNESFHFDILSSPRPPAKPPDDGIYLEPDTGLLTTKVVGDISEHYVLMPKLCPVNDTLILFSSENEDKVHLLSHQGFKASKLFHHKSPMLIHGENTPNDYSDFEASRARGFVLWRSHELQSSALFESNIQSLID
ncbi:hypothetical protein Tco_0128263 [Tanacetum coccineum]